MADPLVPDFWRYYGNKKLSDVDIILAEEEPASAASHSTTTEPDQQAAPDSAADGATGGSAAGTEATTAAAAAGSDQAAAAVTNPATIAATVTSGGSSGADNSTAGNPPATAPTVADARAPGGSAAGSQLTETATAAMAGAEQAPAARDPATNVATTVTADGSSSINPAAGNPAAAPAAAAAAAAEVQTAAADEPTRSSKRKRQEGERILGHSFVLCAFSGYCRTKLEDWDDATDAADQQARSSTSRAGHEIQLLVPAGQLEVGRLLIRGMYQQRPDLSDVSQAQLIQLLLLADRFEVPKVQAAVSAAFKALPPEQLQWDTVVAVYALPAGCAELAACQDLFSAVAAKLQHELGDLELVLTDPKSSKAQQLLELPFGALKQLLQDERTRVASGNTVFYAIQQWHKQQQRQIQAKCSEQPEREQQLHSLWQQTRELQPLVRMLQCSQLFIATFVGQSDISYGAFSYQDLLLASQFGRSAIGQRPLPDDAADLPVFQRHPAWLLPARPPSAMKQLTVDWQLPLAQLKEAFEQQLETGEMTYLCGDIMVWQGLRVYQKLESTSDSSDGTTRQLLGVFCKAHLTEDEEGELSECRSAATAFRAKSFMHGVPDVVSGPDQDLYSNTSLAWGYRDFVELDAVNSWAEAEVVLRNKGLVGGDGCLHLTMTVSDVE